MVSIFDGNGSAMTWNTTPWRIPPSWRWTSRGSSDRVGSSAMYQSHLGKTMCGWNAGRWSSTFDPQLLIATIQTKWFWPGMAVGSFATHLGASWPTPRWLDSRVARRYASDRARRNRLFWQAYNSAGWRHGHQKPFTPDNFCGNRQSEYNPERVVLIFCHYILWLKCFKKQLRFTCFCFVEGYQWIKVFGMNCTRLVEV